MSGHNIRVEHKLLRRGGRIRSRRFQQGGYEHYKLRLYLDGDLRDVKKVVYQLHSTFPDPERTVTDPTNGFALDIWTWGEFHVPVTVYLKDGTTLDLEYELAYSDELPAEDRAYTNEGVGS